MIRTPSHAKSTTSGPRLPKQKRALADTVDRHANREQRLLLPKLTTYRLASLYMQGYRSFSVIDSSRGIVEASPYILSEDGVRTYQSQVLTQIVANNASKLAAMDARPRVGRNGDSLSSIRERAVGQTLLDSITDDHMLHEAIEEFAWVMTCYGMAGITGDVQNHAQLGLTAVPEVIHPRELMPWPSLGDDHTQSRGIVRQRMVPLEQLKEIYGEKVGRDTNLGKMHWYEMDRGNWQPDPSATHTGGLLEERWPSLTSEHSATKTELMRYVLVREVWVDGPAGTVSEYAVTSNEHVFEHQDYSNQEVYRPIQTARFMEDGTWHGLGLFALLFSVHRELEDLQQRMFENVRDLDQHQTLVIPAAQIPEEPTMIDIGQKYKAIGLQVDPMDQTFNPFSLPINNAGDMPGRVAAQARAMIEDMDPLDDIVKDKGRIDSAAGMQVLQEEANRKHTSALRGINRAIGAYHRHNLTQTIRKMMGEGSTKLHMTRISPDLAGVVIDHESNEVGFGEGMNPVPSISHLTFDVRSVTPRNKAAEKKAASETLQFTGDWDGYVLHSIESDFMVDAYVEDYKNAYQMVARNIISVFNNGESPGEAVVTSQGSKPEIQLRVLHAFMSGPIFTRATAEVQDAFIMYQRTLKGYLKNVLQGPPANPDDFAAVIGDQK